MSDVTIKYRLVYIDDRDVHCSQIYDDMSLIEQRITFIDTMGWRLVGVFKVEELGEDTRYYTCVRYRGYYIMRENPPYVNQYKPQTRIYKIKADGELDTGEIFRYNDWTHFEEAYAFIDELRDSKWECGVTPGFDMGTVVRDMWPVLNVCSDPTSVQCIFFKTYEEAERYRQGLYNRTSPYQRFRIVFDNVEPMRFWPDYDQHDGAFHATYRGYNIRNEYHDDRNYAHSYVQKIDGDGHWCECVSGTSDIYEYIGMLEFGKNRNFFYGGYCDAKPDRTVYHLVSNTTAESRHITDDITLVPMFLNSHPDDDFTIECEVISHDHDGNTVLKYRGYTAVSLDSGWVIREDAADAIFTPFVTDRAKFIFYVDDIYHERKMNEGDDS